LAGIILSILILPFKSFPVLILIIPALLSLRGNISGPFIARTSRDLILGEFGIKSWGENVLATYVLAIVTSILIGIISVLMNLFIFRLYLLDIGIIIVIPTISMSFSLSISIPISTILNYVAFKFGFDPNNVVGPTMTAIDDFFSVVSFYLTLILMGVP
jgi:mgtE-like transporter